jgi:hypothetical protein
MLGTVIPVPAVAGLNPGDKGSVWFTNHVVCAFQSRVQGVTLDTLEKCVFSKAYDGNYKIIL